ncbi:hypothetical protein Srot_0917 [Segniliparus rotundus DSM 44985]|uniref:Uncharacterized protein n=1 Tax=Segniliparus rotundus (strain ATCC BAA-972 / CDC 1076 / CIP 108378 / DSM 44985 / JCM 13578) TaxID=640132 RepID=D6ZEB3_SEGRD|nr:hypothetical protein [Segniliparus rotundus]ADG97393.1 hypothetical protein Srot_0917 [Segniliparus rotundus DSM 44985]
MNQADQVDLWSTVSKMLAVLTIGHTSVMLVSKLFGLSESKIPKLVSKLVECGAMMALVTASALLVSTFTRSDGKVSDEDAVLLRSTSYTISQALKLYYVCAGLAFVTFALLYLCFRLAKNGPGTSKLGAAWFSGMIGVAFTALPASYMITMACPGVPERETYSWAGLLGIVLPLPIMATSRILTWRKQRPEVEE